MGQGSIIAAMIGAAFLLFVTARGELTTYLRLLI
jgi:hypothetical protein